MMYIGDQIRKRRARLGYSQREFAEKSGITNVHLSNIERGVSDASPGLLERMAEILGCRVELKLVVVRERLAVVRGKLKRLEPMKYDIEDNE